VTKSAPPALSLAERCDEALFRILSSRNLIYNQCWEDPAIDRIALELGPADTVLTITSAGCNALDYLLEGPRRVIAVDINPRQTALLELKVAAIRALSAEDVFGFFGRGYHPAARSLYQQRLRGQLSPFATRYWDRRISWFATKGSSFYEHGLSGLVARLVRRWMRRNPELERGARSMFAQRDIALQREHYLGAVRPFLWTPFIRWAIGRQVTLSLLGVPMPQRHLVASQSPFGVAGAIQTMVDRLFCTVPAHDNYFWRVYVFGEYDESCRPRYLEPENIRALRDGLLDRLEFHTCSVTEYLQRDDCPPLSRAVLLDHMDWMSSYYPDLLQEEWDALHERLLPNARVLFRSAHIEPPYLDVLTVGAMRTPLREWLAFDAGAAARLSARDRVHTYSSFHIGDVGERAMALAG
jgi:S-adenosylmethionine-diacylglycerol 3-amino-3-carboxypropyl transferase